MDYVQFNQWPLTMLVLQSSKQNRSGGFQFQTQTAHVLLNPSLNKTETTELIPPTEITGISIPTKLNLIPDITLW